MAAGENTITDIKNYCFYQDQESRITSENVIISRIHIKLKQLAIYLGNTTVFF